MFAIIMPPVSVCHQLSWNGRPKVCWLHTTASGLSGSPTLARNRNDPRSYFRATSAPTFISMRIAVGAVYQTVTFCRSRIEYQRSASNSSSSTMPVTPHTRGPMTPYDMPVTQPGSAVHQKMSPSCRSSAYRAVIACATTDSCASTAPLGLPVVPLVKCISAMSSGAVSTMRYEGGEPASRVARARTRSESSSAVPSIRITTLRRGNWPRRPDTLRWKSARVVTSATPQPISRRALIGSGPNAENRGQKTAPRFNVPRTAVYRPGSRPLSENTASPRSMPSRSSAAANRDEDSSRSA